MTWGPQEGRDRRIRDIVRDVRPEKGTKRGTTWDGTFFDPQKPSFSLFLRVLINTYPSFVEDRLIFPRICLNFVKFYTYILLNNYGVLA